MGKMIEKDYYVTMILRLLSLEMPFVVFKGGTSLSKCYKIISRFSEDIDVTVDQNLSQGQKKKLKYGIVDAIQQMGLEILNLNETRSRRDYNRYIVAYESVLPKLNETVQPVIYLETSFTTIAFPTVIMPVDSMIGDMLKAEAPELLERYGLNAFCMKVQGLDRTLADKVFAVCDYYLQNRVRKHSRHLYDIYKLLPLVRQDDTFHALVQEVRSVRKPSPICPSAKDGVNVPALLSEIVRNEAYREDYRNLTERLLEEEVDYDTAVTALKRIAVGGMFA
ncbi:MAG TPA: nucleotidyl transferase AbiEii/AbiGii toxin family protein [Candidatus Eisenbergiella merdipullorum]|uniref:Nucleotidyl transferase AbiEii/AbiGii toxin family protein n=1 Tax=Candidatus Eisenbergiella merdipullorum TaxID=2838553 RepID=A0A9D2I696_9FIRM|nr:nucleotidyl transferase AbiEii/AbiGii toxin family protein [Candidatus Eisenbergiella merdipullorum]